MEFRVNVDLAVALPGAHPPRNLWSSVTVLMI